MKRTGKTYKRKRKRTTYITKGTGSKIIHTGYGSVAKKRSKKIFGNRKNLEKETKRLVSRANARLDSLQRKYKFGTYASKKLFEKLSSKPLKTISSSGRIKLKKNMTKTQLLAVNKAVSNFLNSQTSTKKGIEQWKKNQLEKIKSRFSEQDEIEFTEEDAEDFFEMHGENDFQFFANKIGDSLLQQIIYDSIRENDSEDDFLERLSYYTGESMNDLDLREKAIRLYEKYIK